MQTLKSKSAVIFVSVLGAYASSVQSQGSNCKVDATTCLLTISHSTNWWGADRFIISADKAITPATTDQEVDVYWLLPVGYVFADQNDGPNFQSSSASLSFHGNYVTTYRLAPTSGADIGYHWNIKRGSSFDTIKYSIVFRERDNLGRQWTCDPTIVSFNSLIFSTKDVEVATPGLMNCHSP